MNSTHRPPILFITGTDTGVGKTVLAALLTRHLISLDLRVIALKPVCSGDRGDARALHQVQDHRLELDTINPWHFRAPLAPVLAARRETRSLHRAQVVDHIRCLSRHTDIVIVEGAGGLLSPLGEDFDSRDLITSLRAHPIIVSPNRLGTVNQVRLTLAALPPGSRGRAVAVLVDSPKPDAAAHQNATLLRETEVACPIHTLPWIPNWQPVPTRLPKRTTRGLQRLLNQAVPADQFLTQPTGQTLRRPPRQA